MLLEKVIYLNIINRLACLYISAYLYSDIKGHAKLTSITVKNEY